MSEQERDEWRERVRGRLRRGSQQQRQQQVDPEVADLLAASAARPRNTYRSWEVDGPWGRYDLLSERFAVERARRAAEDGLVGDRQCRYCQQTKPASSFSAKRWTSMCVECRREYDRRRRAENRERLLLLRDLRK